MGFFDDLGKQVVAAGTSAAQSVGSYYASQAMPILSKVATPPAGNLTAAQIEAGSTGSGAQLAPSKAAASSIENARGHGIAGSKLAMYAPLAIAAVAAYFLFKKRG